MNIVKAGYEIVKPNIHDEMTVKDIYRTLERIGRVCYKSESQITDESGERFIRRLIANQHTAMLEHDVMTVIFTVDRGISHELVRHRIASFAQESTRYCVAGDTKLSFKNPHLHMTIGSLYKNVQNSSNGSWKRMHIRQYDENSKLLKPSKIKNVFFIGEKPCIEIKTKLGYSIKCTYDHELLTPKGYIKAGELNVDDDIYVNGTTELYTNRDWLYMQNITLNKTFVKIAEEFGFNANTLKKWARKLKIPKKGTGYFHLGRTPWNKGIQDERQVNALKQYHHCGRRNDKILKYDTKRYFKYKKENCEICGCVTDLEVHHIDKNHENNDPENLMTLCESCHQLVHSQNLQTIYADRIISITDVGPQEVYDIEMDSESHNYIANGFVAHNCNYSKDKFGNEITVVEPCFFDDISEEVKQTVRKVMDGDPITKSELFEDDISANVQKYANWYNACGKAEKNYFRMLKNGATPEEARDVLPTSVKTEIVMTANFREWRHIFDLRAAGITGKPHPQMKEVMMPLLKECAEAMPALFGDIAELCEESKA